MKIDPFQRIALCISVKHFTSFLLLPAKGWPSAKQLINAMKKKKFITADWPAEHCACACRVGFISLVLFPVAQF